MVAPPGNSEPTVAPEGLIRYRLAAIAAGVLWSTSGLFIKALTQHAAWHCSAIGITFYRSLFAALCLLPLLRRRPEGTRLPKPGDLGCSVVLYVLLLWLYVASAQGTTAANAIFLQYTAPLYAIVLGPLFFHEPFRRADAAALIVAMAGVAVLFGGNFHGGEQGPLLMGAGSGLMFGLFLLWLRRMRYADPIAVTLLNNAGVAIVAGAALAWLRPAEVMLFPRAMVGEWKLLPVVGLLALMGAVQIAAPYVLFSWALKRIPGVEGSLLALVEPLLSPLWVALFIGELPTAATIAGGLLILLALAARYTLFRSPEAEPADDKVA